MRTMMCSIGESLGSSASSPLPAPCAAEDARPYEAKPAPIVFRNALLEPGMFFTTAEWHPALQFHTPRRFNHFAIVSCRNCGLFTAYYEIPAYQYRSTRTAGWHPAADCQSAFRCQSFGHVRSTSSQAATISM